MADCTSCLVSEYLKNASKMIKLILLSKKVQAQFRLTKLFSEDPTSLTMDILNSALLELEAWSPVLIAFMLNFAFLCFSVLIPLSLPRTSFCFLQGQSHFNVAYMTYLSNATFIIQDGHCLAVLDMT